MATSIAKLAIMLTTDTSGMVRGFAHGEGEAKKFDSVMTRIGSGMKDWLGGAMWGVAAAGLATITRMASDLLRESLGIADAWERLDRTFGVMMGGNMQAAQDLRKNLSGIDMGQIDDADIQQAAKSMLAMGNASSVVVDRLKRFADISVATGESVSSLADSWLRFQNDGKVSATDLTRLMRAGIPVLQDLESHFGASRVQILEMADAGRISFTEMEESLKRLTNEGGRFAGALKEVTDNTIGGQLRAMKDDLAELAAMGFGFIGDDIGKALGSGSGANLIKNIRTGLGINVGELTNETARQAKLAADEKAMAIKAEGDLHAQMIDEWLKTETEAVKVIEKESKNVIRSIRSFAGLNPGSDYNTTAGASAVGAAKAEMARMVQEQKESNTHLRNIEAGFAGVASF